jgi:hypothetical protein
VSRTSRAYRRTASDAEQQLRARREMEDMKAEMERLRLGKEEAAAQVQRHQYAEVEKMRQEYADMLAAKQQAEEEAAEARAEAERLKKRVHGDPAAASVISAEDRVPLSTNNIWDEPSPRAASRVSPDSVPVSIPLSTQPLVSSATAPSASPALSMPSAKAPTNTRVQAIRPKPISSSRLVSDDSMSESDGDEDFWGAGGVGLKPTLGVKRPPDNGGTGGAASGTASGSGFDHGLDEWAF